MNPGNQVAASPEQLASHAAHLQQMAAGVGTAADAAHTVQLDGQAYGLLLSGILPPLMGYLDGVVGAGIRTAASSMQTTAENMRLTADAYKSTDEDNAATFSWLRGSTP